MVTMLHTSGTAQPFYFLRFVLVWCAIFHPFYFQPVFARMFRCVCVKSINLDYEVIFKIQPVSLWPINYLCVCVCVLVPGAWYNQPCRNVCWMWNWSPWLEWKHRVRSAVMYWEWTTQGASAVESMVSISVGALRPREVRWPAQGHTAQKPVLSPPRPLPLL